jgi:hypothetical protein
MRRYILLLFTFISGVAVSRWFLSVTYSNPPVLKTGIIVEQTDCNAGS